MARATRASSSALVIAALGGSGRSAPATPGSVPSAAAAMPVRMVSDATSLRMTREPSAQCLARRLVSAPA
jgi:hypothetical protein